MENLTISDIFRIPDYDRAEEMQTGLLEFDDEKCTRCGICVNICPGGSIIMENSTAGGRGNLPYLESIAPDVTLCIACGCCLAACPTQAINIKRNFNPGFFYKRLTQLDVLTYPHKY